MICGEHNIRIYPYAHNYALIYAHKFMCINLSLPTMVVVHLILKTLETGCRFFRTTQGAQAPLNTHGVTVHF